MMQDKCELILTEIKDVFEELALKKVEIIDQSQIPFEEICNKDVLVKDPVLSILVITYNHSEFISEALDGILNQETSVPYEIIIGEDCSLDDTREIVLSYQKRFSDKIRVVISKENIGATKNLFRIANLARGKLISICEGDDYWHDISKIQQQVDFLENNSDVELVHCGADIYEHKTKKFLSQNRERQAEDHVITNAGVSPENRIFTCSVCFRKEVFKYMHEITPMIFFNFLFLDRIIWTVVILHSKTCYMPKSMTVYRVVEGSASHFPEDKRGAMFSWQLSAYMFYFVEKHNKPKINFEENDVVKSYYCTMSELAYKYMSKKTAYIALRGSQNNQVDLGIRFKLMNNYVVYPIIRIFIYPVLVFKRMMDWIR